MAKVAMFLARSPGPPLTGRKAVIRSAVAALAAEGHEVELLVLARPDPAAPGARFLGAVPKAQMLCNALASALGGQSLNEALFRSPRLLRDAAGLRGRYDFAIADTIRAAPYAAVLGVPWHLDLDDLLSRRYERYLERPAQLTASLVLGYYADSVPRIAASLPRALLRQVLRIEAARLRRREAYWARRATTVSLVSPAEAETLERESGREVHSLPMSIGIPALCWTPAEASAAEGAFLGGLDYKPNLDALLYYQQEIHPRLERACGRAPRLCHIGTAPPELRRRFSPEVVSFEGYVSDLAPRLRRSAYFVAPMVSGTGIKTKVLEAMALGMPVIGTDHAMAGLRVEHRNHVFVCRRPDEFADGMRYLADPGTAARMGLAARQYVAANFSLDVLRGRWRGVIERLSAACPR